MIANGAQAGLRAGMIVATRRMAINESASDRTAAVP